MNLLVNFRALRNEASIQIKGKTKEKKEIRKFSIYTYGVTISEVC